MKKKKRRIAWIVVIAFLVVLVSAAAVFAYTQANNIKALNYVRKYSPQQRQEILEDNEKQVQKILEKFPEVKVSPLNKEQESLLKNGELSEDDAMKLIMGESAAEETEPSPTGGTETDKVPMNEETLSNEEKAEKRISDSDTDISNTGSDSSTRQIQELFARIYLLRSRFSGELDGLIEQAKQEYISQSGTVDKTALGKKYLGKGTALEKQCDSEMEDLLSQLQVVLKNTGGDMAVVDEIRKTYKNEKSIKKAAILDRYL